MMTEKQAKSYEKIFFYLAIVSIAICFIAFFVPIFKLEILGQTVTELGISYLFVDDLSSLMIGSVNGAKIWAKMIGLFTFICMFVTFGSIYNIVKFSKNKKESFETRITAYHRLSVFCSWPIISYAVFAELLAFIGLNEFHIKPISSPLLVPMAFLIGVLVVNSILWNHYEKAQAGEVKPLSFGVFGSEKTSVHKAEMDKAELLLKYKTLYDSGAITEDEFQKMKETLLNEKK